MSTAKLDKLLERQKQIQEQIKQVKVKESAKKRKDETRRKILVGAAILEEIEAGGFSEEELHRILHARLKRVSDRELFCTVPN